MAGIFGEFFLVSVSYKMKHENSSKKFEENSERNSGQNSGRKIEKFGKLSFCNFTYLTEGSPTKIVLCASAQVPFHCDDRAALKWTHLRLQRSHHRVPKPASPKNIDSFRLARVSLQNLVMKFFPEISPVFLCRVMGIEG